MGSDMAFSARALASEKSHELSSLKSSEYTLTFHRVLLDLLAGPEAVLLVLTLAFLLSVGPRRGLGQLVLLPVLCSLALRVFLHLVVLLSPLLLNTLGLGRLQSFLETLKPTL